MNALHFIACSCLFKPQSKLFFVFFFFFWNKQPVQQQRASAVHNNNTATTKLLCSAMTQFNPSGIKEHQITAERQSHR